MIPWLMMGELGIGISTFAGIIVSYYELTKNRNKSHELVIHEDRIRRQLDSVREIIKTTSHIENQISFVDPSSIPPPGNIDFYDSIFPLVETKSTTDLYPYPLISSRPIRVARTSPDSWAGSDEIKEPKVQAQHSIWSDIELLRDIHGGWPCDICGC